MDRKPAWDFGRGKAQCAGQSLARPTVHVVRGREAVLAMQGTLNELARRTGQANSTRWLEHFMMSPDALLKTPYLLMVGGSVGTGASPAAPDLQGAVLIYEYRLKRWGTKVFATDDMLGTRTVIAPEDVRVRVAAAATQKLMEMGAVTALISVDRGMGWQDWEAAGAGQRFEMATRTRAEPVYLPLAETLDGTLATLGRRTRRNLRSYRRHAETDLGAAFVAEVEMGWTEFLEMNRQSTHPASEVTIGWRYGLLERTSNDETVFAGVRAADGRWLSLIGGRRHGATTEIDWQINLEGLARYSLSTVMRALLLENEIARGTRRLRFEGGTPHPMRHSFLNREVTDLLALRRRSLRAWALRRFARWIFPEKNFLRAALREMRESTTEEHDPPMFDLDRAA